MIKESEIYDLQEAKERIGDLLIKINREGGYGKGLTYLFTPFTFLKVADSFTETGETPVTPFDIPRKRGEELYYSVLGFDAEETANSGKAGIEYKGAVGYIEKRPPIEVYPESPEWVKAREGKPYYRIAALRPEEVDPLNFTLPFRNIPLDKLFLFVFNGGRFYKPVRPLSLSDIMTEEGEKVLRLYASNGYVDFPYWNYEYTKEQLSRGGLDKTLFLSPHNDPDIEDYPDEEDEDWLDNMVNVTRPRPSILSEATGMKITNAEEYLEALQKVLSSPLDKREKRAVIKDYTFFIEEFFLDYALYEFSRTEDYSHLTKILSNYSDFGLSDRWEKESITLRKYKSRDEFIYLSPEEYVLSKYLQHHLSTMVASPSFRELSQATGTPIGIITKAAQFRIWD